MKSQVTNFHGRTLAVLASICIVLYFILPAVAVNRCRGCAGASVKVENVVWTDCPTSGQESNRPPTMTTNGCSKVTAWGNAGINDPCTSANNQTLDIDVGQTQAKVDPIYKVLYNEFGVPVGTNISYEISDAKKLGQITLKSRISGSLTNWDTGGCESVSYEAVGFIDVIPGTCGCSAGGSPPPGSCGGGNNSIDFKINFGATCPEINYEFLWLKVEVPVGNLADPALLSVPYSNVRVDVVTNVSGVIQQVNTPQMLINVHVAGTYAYDLECFYATNVTAKSGGFYGTNGAAFVTYHIENPDGSAAYNRLWVTENRGGSQRQWRYSYNTVNAAWDMVNPDGSTDSTWKTADPLNAAITNFYRQISFNSQILSKSLLRYQYIPAINNTLLLQSINGDDALTETNTYFYYTTGPASNELQEVINPDGSWAYYEYDDQGRKIREYAPYGNTDAPTPGVVPNTVSNPYGVTQYDYSLTNSVDGIDDGGDLHNPFAERKTTVFLPVQNGGSWQLQEVSRTYRITDTATGYEEIQMCVVPGAFYNDANNIRTVTYEYVGCGYTAGRIYEMDHANGTSTYYSYPDEFTTVETNPDGTQTTTVVDTFGNPFSRIETDINTGVVLSQTLYSYTNSSGVPYDLDFRSHDETDLAGRTTHYSYDCCGLASVLDPDGVLTTFEYDSMKRQISSTKYYGGGNGIKTTNSLDVLGRVLKTQRIGTDSTVVTMNQVQYDILGRMSRQTNAMGGVTTATNVLVNNQVCLTNVFPDGGTRIEVYQRDSRLQSVTGSAVHPVRYVYGVEQDGSGGPWREYTKEIKLQSDGSDSLEWVKTYNDGLGQRCKTVYPDSTPSNDSDNPYSEYFYNSHGQLWKQRDADGVWTLYKFNSTTGKLEYTVKPIGEPPAAYGITSYADLDYDSFQPESYHLDTADRITKTERTVVAAEGIKPDLIRADTLVWGATNDSTATLLSRIETSTDGLKLWNIINTNSAAPVVNSSATVYLGNNRYLTNTTPEGAYTTSTYFYGRLTSVVRKDSLNNQLSAISYTYDAHGRQYQATDARNGTMSYGYNNADQISSVTTPAPGVGSSSQTTVTYYNKVLQATNVLNPDGTSVTTEYFLTGELKKTYGSRTYPVEYTYDYAGRMQTMKTWTNYASNLGSAITTWNYDLARGWLTNKSYADGNGPIYSNTPAGRLASRVWARGIRTDYGYNVAGDMDTVVYSDGITPNVTNTYDRRGRVIQIEGTNSIESLTYNDANQLLSEAFTAGPLAGMAVTNAYDSYLRRTAVALDTQTSSTLVNYGYDNASRLAGVTNGASVAIYSYVANSPLVSQVDFNNGGSVHMITTKQYDYLNRLTQISSVTVNGNAPPLTYNYSYNNANQRTQRQDVDGSYWVYQYDTLGQVTSGKKYWSDGTPVAGQQFEYTFDDIGNRRSTKSGGDATGSASFLRTANYTANNLNQYTSRTVPGYVDVMGIGLATNAVTVNGTAAYRHGEYFRNERSVNNSSLAVWTNIIVAESGETSVTGNVFVAKSPESFGYDLDGNLTNDGRWAFTWDAENRLTKIESLAATPVASQRRVVWVFDGKGRRIQQTTYDLSSGSAVVTEDLKFVNDGWRCLTELNASNNGIIRRYAWGLDLSGTLDGAGGVGGLLWMKAGPAPQFMAYDGNGNVMGSVRGSTGDQTAAYEYDPFGRTIRATGVFAKSNPFRFSTKRVNDTSDLVLYEYRAYNPSAGRWLSRDPIGERGGLNLYGFVENHPIRFIDPLGLYTVKKCNIIIFVGHNRAAEPHVPSEVKNEPCSAGSVVACESKGVKVQIPIVGIKPRPDDAINMSDAAVLALDDFKKAENHAAIFCKNAKCECKEVKISIDCSGMSGLERFAMPAGVCGKTLTKKCN